MCYIVHILYLYPRYQEIPKKILDGFQVLYLQVVLHALDSREAPADCLSRMILAMVISPTHLLLMTSTLLISNPGNHTYDVHVAHFFGTIKFLVE